MANWSGRTRDAPVIHHENARARLQATRDSIDIARIGMISTPPTPFNIPLRLVDSCIRYGAAQALLDSISATSEGLCVRGFLPEYDFGVHGWRQTYRERQQTIYRTSEATHNDRKVMILYGARNLKPALMSFAERMEIRGGMLLSAQTLYVKRSNIKTIDVIDISGLQTGEAIWFRTPILFKRGDDMNIEFVVSDWGIGQTDMIQLLGLTIEALGATLCG